MDWAAEGLLDDLDEDARAERVELLDWLAAEGHELDQIRLASDEGLLLMLPADRVVGGAHRYTEQEVAERLELDVQFLRMLRRVSGLAVPEPGTAAYSDADLELIEVATKYAGLGLEPDQLLGSARAVGRAISGLAQSLRALVFELVVEPGMSELELAKVYAERVDSFMPLLSPLLDASVRTHLRQAVRTEIIDASERASGSLPGEREVAVAFADIVGFTRLGEEVDTASLERVARNLEQTARDLIEPPVQLVKTIGDAVLLVSSDTGALLKLCLELSARARERERELADADEEEREQADPLPQLRIGMSYGRALSRGGDWFGSAVNLASRVAAAARPGSVLITHEAHEQVGEDAADFSHVGAKSFKGVDGRVRLFRARPVAAPAER